jgi:D-glutamate cyclase
MNATESTAAFENLDRIANVEMRPQGLPVGIVGQLYRVARGDGAALSHRAAAALQHSDIRRVACCAGIVSDILPAGEVDGPIGAAALAQALNVVGRAADVLVPRAMLRVAERVRSAIHGDFGIADEAQARPEDYDAAVTIEKLGRNRKGVVHTIFGAVLKDQTPAADNFIEALNSAGKLTIGIGDGGNEIGFGSIFDQARGLVPRGADCGCPCHDGLVTSTSTKILFPASVSNFGAYAIVSALGILENKPLLLVSPERISESIEAAVASGCLDGGTFEQGRLADDGIPLDGVMAYVTLCRTIATQHFRATPRHA